MTSSLCFCSPSETWGSMGVNSGSSPDRVYAGCGMWSSCLRKGTPLASRIAQGVSRTSWSCVWKPRVFPNDSRGCQCPFEWYLHPQGCLRRPLQAHATAPGRFYGWTGRLLEKAMATHSSTLAWKIPWMEEPGGLQSMGSLRVGHN